MAHYPRVDNSCWLQSGAGQPSPSHPRNYSDSQIDMVYFKQHLARTDGRPIGTWAREAVRGSKLKPTLSDSRISCGVDFGDLLKLISCGKGSRFRICDMRHASVRGNGASLESD